MRFVSRWVVQLIKPPGGSGPVSAGRTRQQSFGPSCGLADPERKWGFRLAATAGSRRYASGRGTARGGPRPSRAPYIESADAGRSGRVAGHPRGRKALHHRQKRLVLGLGVSPNRIGLAVREKGLQHVREL